jgi:subtilisin
MLVRLRDDLPKGARPAQRLRKHFTKPRDPASLEAAAAAGVHPDELPVARIYPGLRAVVGNVTPAAVAALRKDPLVRSVETLPRLEPIIGERKKAPSPAAIQWGLERMNVPAVWDLGYDGSGVRVGHLDTGVDERHPCMDGAVVAFAITDFLGRLTELHRPAYDSAHHGTHTAAVIAGRLDGDHRVGVAPGAELCSAIVMEGGALAKRVLAGLQWLLAKKVRVVNMSFGFRGEHAGFRDVIRRMRDRGMLPVVAAGNAGPDTTFAPGNYVDSLAVGASVRTDRVWPSSSSYRYDRPEDPIVPEIVAPGDQILSAQTTGGYWKMSGTSAAAPHVAGLAALLFQARPDATVREVEAAIFESCRSLPGEPESRQGRGVPDALAALKILGRS